MYAEASADGQPWMPDASEFELSLLKPERQALENKERFSSGGDGPEHQRDFGVDNKLGHDMGKSMEALYAFAQKTIVG